MQNDTPAPFTVPAVVGAALGRVVTTEFALSGFAVGTVVTSDTPNVLFSTDGVSGFQPGLYVGGPTTVYVRTRASTVEGETQTITVRAGARSAVWSVTNRVAGTLAAALGAKLVANFDFSDVSTVFADDAGTVPITEGAFARTIKAKNNPALQITRPSGGTGVRWSATGFNKGRSAGLVGDGTGKLKSPYFFPVKKAVRASFIVAFQSNLGSGDVQQSLLGWCDNGGHYEDGLQSAYDPTYVLPGISFYTAPDATRVSAESGFAYRLYVEQDATSVRYYLASGLGQPKLVATRPLASDDAAVYGNPPFYYFASATGDRPGKYAMQAIAWLNAPLTDDERAAADAALTNLSNEVPITLALDATPDTSGSMAAGSATLTVADATGYEVGKTVIVNPTGSYANPAGDQFFMTGPGGIWPSASAANEAAVLALTSCPGPVPSTGSLHADVFPYIRAADTGVVYIGDFGSRNGYAKIPGYAKYDGSNPSASAGNWDAYTWRAFPLPLVAKITAKSGNTLTLDQPAVGAVTGGLVAIDNYPAIKAALVGGDGLTVNFPAGSYWMSGWISTAGARQEWQILGAPLDAQGFPTTELKKPRWLRNWFFNVAQHVWPTVSGLRLRGNHMGKLGAVGPMNDIATHMSMNNLGIGVAFSDCKNPLVANCVAHDIPQGAFQIQGGATADTGRPYATGNVPFQTEDGRRLAGLMLSCKVYAYYPHQGYIQWGFGGNALSAPVELRDPYFEARRLTKCIEFFNTDQSEYTRPRFVNGLMSSNSCRRQKINGLGIRWTDLCKVMPGDPDAGPIFQPISDSDGYMLNINQNAYPGSGQGSVVAVDYLIAEGWMHSRGATIPMIACYDVGGWTIQGTYDPATADDGQRRGLIMGPMTKGTAAGFLTGGGRIDLTGRVPNDALFGNDVIKGVRCIPLLGYPGAGGYPDGSVALKIVNDAIGGSVIQNTITGTSVPRVLISRSTSGPAVKGAEPVNVNNISNKAYNALGATGVLNALTLSAQPQVGVAYVGFVRGKREGSILKLSGPGSAGLSVVMAGQGYYVVGTPTTVGAVNIAETLAGCTNSPRANTGIGWAA